MEGPVLYLKKTSDIKLPPLPRLKNSNSVLSHKLLKKKHHNKPKKLENALGQNKEAELYELRADYIER